MYIKIEIFRPIIICSNIVPMFNLKFIKMAQMDGSIIVITCPKTLYYSFLIIYKLHKIIFFNFKTVKSVIKSLL